MRACGIGAGDLVFTVSHTAVATVAAIERAGATPVLIDIEPDGFTMDPASSRGRLQAPPPGRPAAVLPVHLYGEPADLDALPDLARRHGLRLIEDCAQSHGARYRGQAAGSFGDFACFSFYPTKNLGALGDARHGRDQRRALAARCANCANMAGASAMSAPAADQLAARPAAGGDPRDQARRIWTPTTRAARAIAARYDAGLAGLPLALPRAPRRTRPMSSTNM